MSLYRKIFVQAWKNTWTNKYLWFLGLFAAMLGSSSELNLLFNGFGDVSEKGLFPNFKRFAATGIFSRNALANLGDVLVNDSFSLLVTLTIMSVLLLLFCFLIWFSVISQAALVNNYAKIANSKSHNLSAGLEAGMKKFWPVFGLNALLKLIVYIIFIILALPIVIWLVQPSMAQNLFFVIIYFLFIPISIIISFVVKYAIGYSVIKNQKFIESLISGWDLFLKNWLISLEMAFILFGITFLATLLIILGSAILAIPLMFLAFFLPYFFGVSIFWVIFFSSILLFFIIIVILGSIISAFQISSWTGLFLELVNRGGVSKIVRVFGNN